MKISIIIISCILLFLIDSVYLSYFGNFFNKQVEKVQGSPLKLNLWGAIFSYLFLIIGINYFILQKRESWQNAFLLGLVIYGVYEATSYAILKNWQISSVIIDTLWGGILFSLVTYLTYLIYDRNFK